MEGDWENEVSANNVYVSGDFAYVAAGNGGLHIIDISSPTSPQEIGYHKASYNAIDIYISDSYAYVAAD